MRTYPVVLSLVLLSLNCALAHEREPPRYRLIEVEDASTGLETAIAEAMNNHASMTGEAFAATDPARVAFLWRKRQLTALEGDGSITPFQGLGINDRGQVVGHALISDAVGINRLRGFVWTRGQLTHIGDLPGGIEWSIAYDINERRQVVGASEASNGLEAVLWQDGNLMSLGDLPGGRTAATAYAINDWGVVVGQGHDDEGFRPFLWRHGTMRELPLPEGSLLGFAEDINNFNVAVGVGVLGDLDQALLWRPRRDVKVLPVPSGFTSAFARAINDFGDVVGAAQLQGGSAAATLWHRGVAYDLNDLIVTDDPLKTCVAVFLAQAINERGEIAAMGANACENDSVVAFLLKPVRTRHQK